MTPNQTVITESWDRNRRLAELGLREDILTRSSQRGWLAMASCTRNHPPGFPAIYAWADGIASLGDDLVLSGWNRINESMWPLVVNPEGTIAITVASGNEDTGTENDPLTRSPKGSKTETAILMNQLWLPGMLPSMQSIETRGRILWVLLAFRDIPNRQMRVELSRPSRMGQERRINGWAERIILPPQELDGIPETLRGDGGPQYPELDIEIRRRG